jgi:adenylylsulfate kinase
MIIQLTGLSGSGKTTIACAVQQELEKKGIVVEVIDGDVYRKTLCRDLGFSQEDRMENIRRLGAHAQTVNGENKIIIIAAINPYEKTRKELTAKYDAKTVWVYCPIGILIKRDTKGFYQRALLPDGDKIKIYNFTGISDPYEEPSSPDLVINTAESDLKIAVDLFIRLIFKSMKHDPCVSVPFHDMM